MNKRVKAKKLTEEELAQKKKIASGITLGIYAAIFIILIIFIRLSNSVGEKVELERKKEEEKYYINSDEEVTKFLKYKNYSFNYTLKIDDVTYVYSGKRYKDKEKYQITKGFEKIDVYRYKELALVKKGDDYVLTEIPAMFFNFFDSDLINKIITNSKYDKKKSLYEIKTKDLEYILDNQSVSTSETINSILLTYVDKNVSSITFDITNFANKNEKTYSLVLLELQYADFNTIEDFEIGE